ncbi:uncharacterized protein A1O5_03936 [Cladophialophora psammophila CBS 110553]|uniref:Uncharacterized protein n=1 Tax=Cladophialophora psammophila CBS 110553 TaxID=1182543 RepID=W9XR45_9EURO|nr:uncharacterized protein A1O5_03936 [Cladophialophora psammophila CBS 110553]EXJ72789.1 hypothetical protein A1O5_03936 [Cladophialophora psammophila CBS 110553]
MGCRDVDEVWAQAEANGYSPGAHAEQDQVRGKGKHVKKTIRNHDGTLNRYVLWQLGKSRRDAATRGAPAPTEAEIRQKYLGEGVEAPDLLTVKDFARFYIATSQPRIVEVPTVDAINGILEFFFAGFTRVTGTETKDEDRSEVYNWVRKTLTAEGVVVKAHLPKHNFTARDLTRLLVTLWTKDDLIFIHERYRIQFTLITCVYCWTGARLGAFFTGGLRYEDITLVLQRTDEFGRWRFIYRLDQRWVKNNRDPENIVFGTAGKEHDIFIYNEAAFFAILAITDGALFGISSVEDLRDRKIAHGKDEVILEFNDSALSQPILRKCTKNGGVTNEPMPRSAYEDIFRSTLQNANYFCAASMHAIRRALGKEVDKDYTPVQRSQHLIQADREVFGAYYMANCSSVDGQGAFLRQPKDHRHIDYFQSLEKFHEPGLPCSLPSREEKNLEDDARLLELKGTVDRLEREEGKKALAVKKAKKDLELYRKKQRRIALRRYQKQWVRDRRRWQILSRGKERPSDVPKTDLVESLCLLIPERGRLAHVIAQEEPLSRDSMWYAMLDLHSLCTRDLTVLYLAGLEPRDGNCPMERCREPLNYLPKHRRNQHILLCVRQAMASKLDLGELDIHYCHLCFEWVIGDDWEPHCQTHINALSSKRCGTITYCHTLVRPGYSPFRLGSVGSPAAYRLQSWTRDHHLWGHVNDCTEGCQWPIICPHPLCQNVSLEDDSALYFHFVDDHYFSRTRPVRKADEGHPKSCPGDPSLDRENEIVGWARNWKPSTEDGGLKWAPLESGHVRATQRRCSLSEPRQKMLCNETATISPRLLSRVDHVDDQPIQLDPSSPCSSSTHGPRVLDMSDIGSDLGLTDKFHEWNGHLDDSLYVNNTRLDTAADADNDSVIFQFVRSLSPSRMSAVGATVADATVSDSESPGLAVPSPVPLPVKHFSAPQLEGLTDFHQVQRPPASSRGTQIRLRVNPTKPKIVLRLSCSTPKPKPKPKPKEKQKLKLKERQKQKEKQKEKLKLNVGVKRGRRGADKQRGKERGKEAGKLVGKRVSRPIGK